MKIAPVGFRVLIKVERNKEKSSESSIIIPEAVRDKEVKGGFVGTVVALGPTAYKGFDKGEAWVKPGDKVVFRQYSGIDDHSLTLVDSFAQQEKGDVHRLINDDDIYGIVIED